MTERELQSKFTRMVGHLIHYATAQGYELTFGDTWSKPEYKAHIAKSYHYRRLAVDFNLFKDKVYLTDTNDYEPLGLYWESLGGTWGGRFTGPDEGPDGCHFSLGEKEGL